MEGKVTNTIQAVNVYCSFGMISHSCRLLDADELPETYITRHHRCRLELDFMIDETQQLVLSVNFTKEKRENII